MERWRYIELKGRREGGLEIFRDERMEIGGDERIKEMEGWRYGGVEVFSDG